MKLKTIKKFSLLVLFSLIPGLGLAQQQSSSSGHCDYRLREQGCVSIPFTSNIQKDEIKDKLDPIITENFEVVSSALGDALKAQLKGVSELGDKIPDTWGSWDDMVREIIDDAEASAIDKINEKRAEFIKEVNQKVDETASKLKMSLDAAAPNAEITAEYEYCEGVPDPGDPGWGSANDPIIRGTKKIDGSAKASFGPVEISIDITPLGVGGSVSVSLHGEVSMSGGVEFKADSQTGPSPVNKPTATVKCTPSADITVGGALSGGGIIGVGIGADVTWNKPFNQLSGIIKKGVSCAR